MTETHDQSSPTVLMRPPDPKRAKRRRWWHFVLYGVGLMLLAELVYIAWHWPDWDALRQGQVPESAVIAEYREQRKENTKLPPLRWQPLTKSFPRSTKKVFVIAEDSRFYEHGGLDFQAIAEAIAYNRRHGRIIVGASTISQQTAKNKFLSLSRTPVRKAQELVFTYLLEAFLTKEQILHIYLNIAEFGPGVYGLEAAARQYFRTSAHKLSQAQAIELAASLPSPRKHNPKTRTRAFQRRYQRIAQTLRVMDQYVASGAPKTGIKKEEVEQKLEELRREMSELPGEAPAPSPAEAAQSSLPDASPEAVPSASEAAVEALPPAAAAELPSGTASTPDDLQESATPPADPASDSSAEGETGTGAEPPAAPLSPEQESPKL